MDKPCLIDTGVSNYLQNALKHSHITRVNLYSVALNVGVLVLFVLVFGILLYYRYTNKPSAYEVQKKMHKDQEYILSKIRFYQAEQKNLMTSPIGNF